MVLCESDYNPGIGCFPACGAVTGTQYPGQRISLNGGKGMAWLHHGGMTSKERVLAAISHQGTDRVPFDLWMTPEIEKALETRVGLSGWVTPGR